MALFHIHRKELPDDDNSPNFTLDVEVIYEDGFLCIWPSGYSVKDGENIAPIMIEHHRGQLKLTAYPNANSDEPVVINMEAARKNPFSHSQEDACPSLSRKRISATNQAKSSAKR